MWVNYRNTQILKLSHCRGIMTVTLCSVLKKEVLPRIIWVSCRLKLFANQFYLLTLVVIRFNFS